MLCSICQDVEEVGKAGGVPHDIECLLGQLGALNIDTWKLTVRIVREAVLQRLRLHLLTEAVDALSTPRSAHISTAYDALRLYLDCHKKQE